MKKFRSYVQNQPYLLPPSEEDLIEEQDLVRVVNNLIDGLDFRKVESRFSGGGCPSFHPRMMLKVLVYAYSQGVYSSRKIANLLKRDIHFMWLSGRQRPDFRTINRFRGKYFADELPGLFGEVAKFLLEEGYIKCEEFFVDGTYLEADANKNKVVWRKNTERYKSSVQKRIKEILRDVDSVNDAEDEFYDGKDLPEYGKSSSLTSEKIKEKAKEISKKLNKKQQKELKTLGEKLQKYEEQEETLGKRNSYSKTDPEATAMRMKDDSTKPAYNLQVSGENGFVVGYSVHQDRTDSSAFKQHFDSLKFKPKRMVGDSGYGSEINYKTLEEEGVDSFLKYGAFHREISGKLHPFAKESFDYDEDSDCYHCPKGDTLKLNHIETSEEKTLKVYKASACFFCSARPVCCYSQKTCRTVRRSDELERLKAASKKNLISQIGVVLRKRRGNEAESIFGLIKHIKNFRRVRLRGIRKITTEIGLLLVAANISKVALIRNA